MKATGIKTFQELRKTFIKNKKFIRFTDSRFKRHDLCNFNIAVAKLLFEEGCLSKNERLKQNSLYSYKISGWNHKVFREHDLTHLGQVVERCINKDGSFKPIGGKGRVVATNYRIACILKQEGFLSEKAFLQVQPPVWKYRRLTEKELGETKDIVINVTKWPTDTIRVISTLYKRRYNLSWDRYLSPTTKRKTVTLGFLAEEFLRIPSYSDMPIFKTKGHRLHLAFATVWTDQDLQKALEIVEKTLRDNFLLP